MSKIEDVLSNTEELLQLIAILKGKLIKSDSEKDFVERLSQTPGIALPVFTVLYSGTRAVQEAGATSKTGTSAEVVLTLVVASEKNRITKDNLRKYSLAILDDIREVLLDKRSTTGHKFRFFNEIPAVENGKMVLWTQTWMVPIQLS